MATKIRRGNKAAKRNAAGITVIGSQQSISVDSRSKSYLHLGGPWMALDKSPNMEQKIQRPNRNHRVGPTIRHDG